MASVINLRECKSAIPTFGLGTWTCTNEVAELAVSTALSAGMYLTSSFLLCELYAYDLSHIISDILVLNILERVCTSICS